MKRGHTFLVLAVSTAFLGATVGVERSVLSVLGQTKFGLSSKTALLSFLVSFGLAKALSNLGSGPLLSRFGLSRVLRLGWTAGLAVPALVAFAPNWAVVVAANALLGINQGICWSVAVVGMMQSAGAAGRGAAAGTNEFAGYMGVAVAAAAAGWLGQEAGVELAPFLLMQALAVAGFCVSFFAPSSDLSEGWGINGPSFRAGEPLPAPPSAPAGKANGRLRPSGNLKTLFKEVSFSDRSLASACMAGLVTNLTDAAAWALFPILFTQRGMMLHEIAVLSAAYPAVWAAGQLATGAISDRIGRKPVIVSGLLVQAAGVALLLPVHTFLGSLGAMAVLGAGTALSYPALLAYVADKVPGDQRFYAVGIYRLWRDLGYVAGAVLAGVAADAAGVAAAIGIVAGITALAAMPIATSPAPAKEASP